MVNRSDRYGKLVRGWDWRTSPERLKHAQRLADWLGVNRTTLIEMAIDKELKMIYLTEDNAGGLMIGNPIVGWWDVTEVQNESSFADDAAAIAAGNTKDWTVEHYESNGSSVVATYLGGNISIQSRYGRAAQIYLRKTQDAFVSQLISEKYADFDRGVMNAVEEMGEFIL